MDNILFDEMQLMSPGDERMVAVLQIT